MENDNFLTLIPVLRPKIRLEPLTDDKTLYQVLLPRTNWLERLSIRYLKQPTHHCVRLDQLGSYVLRHCSGKYPVEQIENFVLAEFGPIAEPVRERLIAFLIIVEANGWIELRES